jgi:hypothetical protein
MKGQPNLENILRQAEGFNDRLQKSLDSYKKNQSSMNTSTAIIKPLTLLLCAIFLISCNNDDAAPELKTSYTEYWQSRHDAIPETMQGEWTSVSEPGEIKMIITDKYVMPENVTISPEQDNAVNTKDSLYIMYQNGSVYILSFGTGEYSKYLTLTVNNKCVTRMQRFEPQTPTPTQPEQPNNFN